MQALLPDSQSPAGDFLLECLTSKNEQNSILVKAS